MPLNHLIDFLVTSISQDTFYETRCGHERDYWIFSLLWNAMTLNARGVGAVAMVESLETRGHGMLPIFDRQNNNRII